MLRTLVLLPDAVASCSGRRSAHCQLVPSFVQAQRDRLARKQAASPWSSQTKLQGSSSSSAAARLRGVGRCRNEQSGPTQQLGNGQQQQGDDTEWVIINFYHLCDLPEPKQVGRRRRHLHGTQHADLSMQAGGAGGTHALSSRMHCPLPNPSCLCVQFVEAQRAWVEAEGLNITGRIYFSSQGVNAQFGGPREDALAYTNQLQEHPLFRGLYFSVWPATGPMFPKLRLKYKPNLISLAGGMEGLPVTKPDARATKLNPAGWKDMISQAEQRKVVVLDVRNGYEWDAGHFAGAQRPAEEVFSETPVGESQADIPEPLRGADPNTPVMM
jgi:hypothetical protein